MAVLVIQHWALNIKMFPKHKKAFFDIQDDYEYFVSTIHELYCSCYIYKSISIHDIEPIFFTHIYKIHHDVYLPSLLTIKNIITRDEVYKYLAAMDPYDLLANFRYSVKPNYVVEI